mmetsp:Transcript_28499/g.59927  ORF Transcript_28499/g.59927 Transcript_28499/m.59927 type:complete len:308 (-) Transcript_28499:135-1058(-)
MTLSISTMGGALLLTAAIHASAAFTTLNTLSSRGFVQITPFTRHVEATASRPSNFSLILPSYSHPTSTRVHSSSLFDWFAPPKENVNVKNNEEEVRNVKAQIEEAIANTDRGRCTTPTQKSVIHTLLAQLESLSPLTEPARDPRMGGSWIVLYTDAPPPSNGQLGFLKGIAKQVIDLEGGRYKNELYVGGKGGDEDEGAWLTAVLDADWKEWDGVYLDGDDDGDGTLKSGSGSSGIEVDYGATTWKVTFESLTLSLFRVPLFTQQFKAGTSRTWKMTYLDDETRIVKAGKTGREEDDWVFYMRRGIS